VYPKPGSCSSPQGIATSSPADPEISNYVE